MSRRLLSLVPLLVILAGCDQLGLESATATAARHEAEGRAVGGACRHAGRAIEDCFALNRKTDKAAIYAGWREMDDYMRENKVQVVRPGLDAGPPTKHAEADEARDAAATSDVRAEAPEATASVATSDKGEQPAGRDVPAAKADKPAAQPDKPIAHAEKAAARQ